MGASPTSLRDRNGDERKAPVGQLVIQRRKNIVEESSSSTPGLCFCHCFSVEKVVGNDRNRARYRRSNGIYFRV